MNKNILLLVACLAFSISAKSQVFGIGNKSDYREGTTDYSEALSTPGEHNSEYDSYAETYTPLGGGAALLIGFGAAYLMAKKGKK